MNIDDFFDKQEGEDPEVKEFKVLKQKFEAKIYYLYLIWIISMIGLIIWNL